MKLFSKEKEKKHIPINHYIDTINRNLQFYINLLNKVVLNQDVISYIDNPDKDYIYTSNEYGLTIDFLKNVRELSNEIFISFLGTPKNLDCVDNFGHSRYLRKKKQDEEYNIEEREWYIDSMKSTDDINYTKPYLAESGSYVISIVKKVYNEGKYIGVLGIDILFESLARIKNGDNIILFNPAGIIYYNSHPQLNYIIEKQNNILYMISCSLFNEILSEKNGESISRFCSVEQTIEYTQLFNEVYLLKTEHLKIT